MINSKLRTALIREALKDAELVMTNGPIWTHIETRDFGDVILNYGSIHSNEFLECPIATIRYQWHNESIHKIVSVHV